MMGTTTFRLSDTALTLVERGLGLEVLGATIDHITRRERTVKAGHVRLHITSDTLDFPITVPFVRTDVFSSQTLLNYVSNVLSSKDIFSLEEPMTIDRVLVFDPAAAGRKLRHNNATTFEQYIALSLSVWNPNQPSDRQTQCLGYAVACALLIRERVERGLPYKRCAFYKEPSASREMKRTVDRLYERSGVTEDGPANSTQLRLMADYLDREYALELNVLDQENQMFFASDHKHPVDRRIYLLWFAEHLYLLEDPEAFVRPGWSICPHCSSTFLRNRRHDCPEFCDLCTSRRIHTFEGVFHCGRCMLTFEDRVCYQDHLSKDLCCRVQRRCETCLRPRKVGMPHKCAATPVCRHCHERPERGEVHLCHIPRPSKYLTETPDEYNLVFYDFETRVNQLTGRLEVYCASRAVLCEYCINFEESPDPECELCGPRYATYYGRSATDDFMKWLMGGSDRLRLKRTIAMAHNASRFDHYFVLGYLIDCGMKPRYVCRGNQVITLSYGRLLFKDSYEFLKFPLDAAPKAFGFENLIRHKGFYAWKLADRSPLDYRGELPPTEMFGLSHMNTKRRREFLDWYAKWPRDTPYDMREQCEAYCELDVRMLTIGTLRYQKATLTVNEGSIDPVLSRYTTLASYCNGLFRTGYQRGKIGIVPFHVRRIFRGKTTGRRRLQGYRNLHASSKPALAYFAYVNAVRTRNGHPPLTTAESSPREMRVGRYRVDAMSEDGRDVYEFLVFFSRLF